jgi:hypothetical protein
MYPLVSGLIYPAHITSHEIWALFDAIPLPDVAVPLCELQFGLEEAPRPLQGKNCVACKDNMILLRRRKTKRSSFTFFDNTYVKYFAVFNVHTVQYLTY